MKNWKKYLFSVNGFEMEVLYNADTIENIFLPLLKKLTQMQKEKEERLIVFMAAPPAVGKSTLCQFLEYLSTQKEEITKIQSLGLDGFHYHTDYILSHNVYVMGKEVPMKQVKGCPETFNTTHFLKKLQEIKEKNTKWPIYDRNLHDVVEDVVEVTEKIVLIEGNWLLLKEEPWASIKLFSDYSILIRSEEEMLKERLINRKMHGGFSRKDAEDWYKNSDSVNVKRVLKNSAEGNLNLQIESDGDYVLKMEI